MALLFLDSADHYSTSQGVDKYQSFGGGVIVAGRHGNGIQFPNAIVGVDPAHARVIAGLAFYPTALGVQLIQILDTLDTFAGRFIIGVDSTGALIGNYSYLLTPLTPSAAGLVHVGTWYYLEINALTGPDGSATIEVRLDGVVRMSASGLAMPMSSPSPFFWNRFDVGRLVVNAIVDDIYLLDGSTGLGGAAFTTYLGDITIICRYPNAAGDLTEWTSSTVSPNWQNIDEAPPDDDLTYNFTTTVGARDLVHLQDINGATTVLGAQYLMSGRRTGASFANVAPLHKEGGVVFEGATRALPSSYAYTHRTPFEVSPAGLAWTPTIFNALQSGYKRTL